MDTLQLIVTARELLADPTPLKTDCGILCGAACCAPDEDGQGGVWLFPGEEALYRECGWAEIVNGDFAPMLLCRGTCPRGERPLACRFFPLSPCRNAAGQIAMRVDRRSRAMCPLSRSGRKAFDPAFAGAVRSAFRLMDREKTLRAFLDAWARKEAEFAQPFL